MKILILFQFTGSVQIALCDAVKMDKNNPFCFFLVFYIKIFLKKIENKIDKSES